MFKKFDEILVMDNIFLNLKLKKIDLQHSPYFFTQFFYSLKKSKSFNNVLREIYTVNISVFLIWRLVTLTLQGTNY